MEEVRRGLISFTQFALPHDANEMGDLKAGGEESLPVVGLTGGFDSFKRDEGHERTTHVHPAGQSSG
jgi:hypothetical protein